MQSSKSCTREQKEQLEGHFLGLMRKIKKEDIVTPGVIIRQLTAMQQNESIENEFKELHGFFLSPKLEHDQTGWEESKTDRKKFLLELINQEINKLKQQQYESYKLRRRSISSLGSSITNVLTSTQKQIYWVYIEFESIDFITALLKDNENEAHTCLFNQVISLDTRCFNTCEEASAVMSNNERYLKSLYQQCLIPARIAIEITISNIPTKELANLTLKQLSPSKVSVLKCILGNANFKESYCDDGNNNLAQALKIAQQTPEFIKKFKLLMASEESYEEGKRIIVEHKKEGCVMS